MMKIKPALKNIFSTENRKFFLPLLIIGMVLGLIIGGGDTTGPGSNTGSHGRSGSSEQSESDIWTCSMHPQIRLPEKGKCPLCGMDLIPAGSQADDQTGGGLRYTTEEISLAEIRTSPVQRKFVRKNIRLSGKVTFDETSVRIITSKIPGRLDRLFVNFTGAEVNRGDPLAMIYSPELISAQQELIQAVRSPGSAYTEVVRAKLRLWGLTSGQIEKIERSGVIREHMTVFSPFRGIIVHKNAMEGMYIKTGTGIYTIAELNRVWIMVDAYESDLPWIRTGQEISIDSDALPGEVFSGIVSFVHPMMNPESRTVKVRVEMKNPGSRLKPDMYVRAVLNSEETSGEEAPLVIPETAPLITGTRAVVYVAVKDRQGVFEGREVVLGPKAGPYYLVREGLREGEQIVTNGAFKIDSDLQIRAKPSMMSPEGGVPVSGHDHGPSIASLNKEVPGKGIPAQFRRSVTHALSLYFNIGDKLSRDSLADSVREAQKLIKELKGIEMNLVKGESHIRWMDMGGKIRTAAEKLALAKTIDSARAAFEMLTGPVYQALTVYGTGQQNTYYRFHCPMAFDNKGAFWLQTNTDTRNPYFGESMLTCKDSIEQIQIADEK